MKILIVQDYLRSGGTERQSILLANAFAAAAHDSALLTFRPGGVLGEDVAPEVARHTLQPFDTGLDWFAPGLRRAAGRFRPDIVLCMGRMANCYAGTLHYVVRDFEPAIHVVATMRTGKPLPWLFRRSLQRVSHIVANSRDARDTLVTHHAVPVEKITVIHNSLVFPSPAPASLVDGMPPPRSALRAQYNATAATTVFLCVAMFRPEKNQRELIEIAAGLPADADCQLWLAGDGAARASCEQLVAEKNLGARVKFPGFHRDPSPLYAAADFAVHASGSEALSNFLIEAQAHGLPAVAYAAQGISECFNPGDTGFVIARGDRAAFRAAITRLMTEPPDTHNERAARARDYARTTFDPQRQVAAYLELFQKLSDPREP